MNNITDIHIKRLRQKKRKSPEVKTTGWCGHQATVGEYEYIPYKGPRNTALVHPKLRFYGPDFRPALRPDCEFVEPTEAHLSNCPGCKKQFKQGAFVPTPESQRLAAGRAKRTWP